MEEIVKHINDTNASYRSLDAGDAKNTDLFLDNEHYELFKGCGEKVTVRFDKDNLTKAILFIASTLPRKFDCSSEHHQIAFSVEFVRKQIAVLDAFFTVNGEKVTTREQTWEVRKDYEQANGKIDKRFYMKGLIEPVTLEYNGVVINDKFTIRNYLNGGYSNVHIRKAQDGVFDVIIENDPNNYHNDATESEYEVIDTPKVPTELQQIYYGAPGTGKSHKIKKITKGKEPYRTTFHPDTDYASFVGAYKPTMGTEVVRNVAGDAVVRNSVPETKECIIYEFVPQTFLLAYEEAWRKQGSEDSAVYLVIEEINRGNCAQIFGDLFQLLDRNDEGYSEYPIHADADLKKQLRKMLSGISVPNEADINSLYSEKDVVSKVKSGEILLLPNNLYIMATMNTSDQSLFPIDSAFKRRWDWQYVPIFDAHKNWVIKIGSLTYKWYDFIEAVNKEIYGATSSEDKELGYFFCKAKNGVVDAKTFVGKVIFYLWNDVFKDYDIKDTLFKDANGAKITFDKFYRMSADDEAVVVNEYVQAFLSNLKVEPISSEISASDEETVEMGSKKTKFSVNGIEVNNINAVPYTVIKEYVATHQDLTADEVYEYWEPFKKYSIRKWIVATEESKKSLSDGDYSVEIQCGDNTKLWVNKDGWMYHPKNPAIRDTLSEFIKAVKDANLGITIDEIAQ
jgi:hypothetical protein